MKRKTAVCSALSVILVLLFSLACEARPLPFSWTVQGVRIYKNIVISDETIYVHEGVTTHDLESMFGVRVTAKTDGALKNGDAVDCALFGKRRVRIHGDADGDNRVTARDARFCLRVAAGLAKCSEEQNFVMRSNCNPLSADDARDLLRQSAGLYNPVSAPSIETDISFSVSGAYDEKSIREILEGCDVTGVQLSAVEEDGIHILLISAALPFEENSSRWNELCGALSNTPGVKNVSPAYAAAD